jgi:DNA-binding GntR family transcriptional regulator
VTPRALAGSSRWSPTRGQRAAPPRRCSTCSWPRGASRRRSWNGRASRRSRDKDESVGIVDRAIAEHPDVVERIRGGNAKAIGALMGPVMRETKGRADGGEVQRLIREKLGL